MSFEGYYQVLCKNGHYWEDAYCYHVHSPGEEPCPACDPEEWRCDDCGAKRAWINTVDDTNCDDYGKVELTVVGQDEHGDIYKIPDREANNED